MSFVTRAARTGIVAGVLIAAGASAAPARTLLPAYSGPPSKGNPAFKPASIVYSGDGSAFFAGKPRHVGLHRRAGKLHWISWGAERGRGTGENWLDNCTPNCAAGKFSQYPVTLVVYRPRRLDHRKVFTRMKVTYTGKGPKATRRTEVWKIEFRNGIFDFVFPAG